MLHEGVWVDDPNLPENVRRVIDQVLEATGVAEDMAAAMRTDAERFTFFGALSGIMLNYEGKCAAKLADNAAYPATKEAFITNLSEEIERWKFLYLEGLEGRYPEPEEN